MAKTPYYTKAEADSKNQETLRDVKQTTEAISAGQGGKLYDSLTAAQAVDPKPVDGTVFEVSDADPANSGLHKYLASETGGTKFIRKILKEGDVGFITIPPATNIIADLIAHPYTNQNEWKNGWLKIDGTIETNTTTIAYSVNFIKAYPGVYNTNLSTGGSTSKILAYDKDYNIIGNFVRTAVPNWNLTLPENTEWIRISQAKSADVSTLFFNTVYGISTLSGDKVTTPVVLRNSMRDFYKQTLKIQNPPIPKFPLVTFISDDGHLANDEWYIPILNSKGVKATFAIFIDAMKGVLPDYWNEQRVREVYEAGHDIAGHSVTHTRLTTLTLAQAESELRQCKTELTRVVGECSMFVSPNGDKSDAVDELIRRYFKADFRTYFLDWKNPVPIDTYDIRRMTFDVAGKADTVLIDDAIAAVDTALVNGDWLIFTSHPQFDEYSATANPSGYAERRDELAQLIDYIQGLGIPILPAKQAFEIYKNKVEIGNVRLDSKYYALGIDGTESGTYFD